MAARPPRASTRSDGKRAKTRGATQSERGDRPDRRRAPSAIPAERGARMLDDELLEAFEGSDDAERRAPGDPVRLRMLVLEAAPHLAAAQGAIVAAGHAVATSAGLDGTDAPWGSLGEVDAVLVGMPGGEPLIDAALARGARRPVVIAAWTGSAVEAARRAAAAGVDLATVRPHHAERLAPILLAAGRLIERRAPELARGADPDPEPAGLLPAEAFAQAARRERARAGRYGYPLAVALFAVDAAPPPPPGLRGVLRARAGNALVHALRDVDLATGLDQDRFLVVMPHTDRAAGAEVARRIIAAVAAGDPVIAAGRTFPPRVIGAVTGSSPGDALDLPRLVHDVTQLLDQAHASGASLAVES